MAHFQVGDRIRNRKGGPTYRVQSILADGRLLVSKMKGGTKFLTRPEDFVHVAKSDQKRGGPPIAQLSEEMGPRVGEA
jgi:hypothetical protein